MDLLEQLEELDAPALVCPPEPTFEVFPIEEYVRTREAWVKEHGLFNAAYRYPGWRIEPTGSLGDGGRGHTHYLLSVYDDGALKHRAICDACGWGTPVGTERETVALWHDHAWPGWRDLPVVPLDIAPRGGGMDLKRAYDKVAARRGCDWVQANYLTDWHVDRAPILSERSGYGTRDVPGYSPWAGFDIWEGTREVAHA